MKYLVVNGDDFGYSRPRNDGIIRCFREGVVTSTSLLINGEALHHAVGLIRRYDIPTGLHLNLTEGNPLTDAIALRDDDGYMLGKYGFRNKLSLGIDLLQVEDEIQAQIDKFQELLGRKPCHVDGHQHVHVLPGLSETFCRVLKRNNVHVTRLPIENISNKDLPNKDFLQTVINNSLGAKVIFDHYNIRYTDKFVGLNSEEKSVDSIIDSIKNMLNGCNHGDNSCEFMVHPGYKTKLDGGCGNGSDEFSRSEFRVNEMNFLCDAKLRNFIDQSNLKLTSFENIFWQKQIS